ncbi:MAG: hypothetical protein RIC95_12900 [Vicingaceae bacterium]
MRKKVLVILHFLLVIVLIGWNYLTNTGKFHEQSVGEVSAKLYNLFTPASYAFSIWGLIFIALLIKAVFLLVYAFRSEPNQSFIKSIPYTLLAYLGIMAWLWFWLQQNTLLSVLIMAVIFISLWKSRSVLSKEEDSASKQEKWLLIKPIELLTAWVMVALLANISAHLTAVGWNGWGLKDESWTMLLIGTIMLLNYLIVSRKGFFLFPIVSAWALVAISVKHYESQELLFWYALIAAFIVLSFLIKRRQETLQQQY